MNEIESIDMKASYSVIRVFWNLLNVVFDADEEDALSFQEKELLEDVLRYGTIANVSRLRGVNYSTLTEQFRQALIRLTTQIDIVGQLKDQRAKYAAYEEKIREQRGEVIEAKATQIMLENQMSQLHKKIEQMQSELEQKNKELSEKNNVIKEITAEADKNRHSYEKSQKELTNQIKKSNIETSKYQQLYSNTKLLVKKLKADLSALQKRNTLLTQKKKTCKKSTPKKENPQSRHYKEKEKLKSRITSLENLLLRYKEQGPSALEIKGTGD